MSDEFCAHCGTRFAASTDRFCARCGVARDARARAAAAADSRAQGEDPSPRRGEPRLAVRPTRRPVWASLLFAVVLAAVPAFVCISAIGGGSAEGQLVATGPRAFTFAPDGCASMQPFGRAGANVHGKTPNDGGVYVTVDPIEGSRIDVEIPGSCKNADGTDCTVLRVPRAACTRWEVKVEFSGTVVNDVRQYEGYARFECVLEDGTRLSANLTFDGC